MESRMSRPRVVLAILDAFPHHHVSPGLTPVLARLAEEGARAARGGRAVLTASTYPNHASFVTGVGPDRHGIVTSRALTDEGLRPAQEVGPTAPTLFDDCRAAGLRSVGLFGDQNLVHVCGALSADAHWPPEGVLPEDAPRGRLGYGADRAVVEAADEASLDDADLVVLQLDEVDTARHLHDPDGADALEQCRATDAAFGGILERLRGRWHETIVIAVSDHDTEPVRRGAVDLHAEARARGLDVHVEHDGTACLVLGETTRDALLGLPTVTGAERLAADRWVVWGDAGQQYGIDWGLAGQHGSPRTGRQLAVVGGGHAEVARLAGWLEGASPLATEWAAVVRGLLGIDPVGER
jgi:hypothetical protein